MNTGAKKLLLLIAAYVVGVIQGLLVCGGKCW
jgi:hypothetical protein